MSQSVRTFGAAALGALVVAVLALTLRPMPASGAPTTTDTPAIHTITVAGTGTITLVPDTGHVSVGVTVSKPTVKAARAAAAASMTAIIDAIRALGIDEKDIKTTGLNLYPQYDNRTPARVVGYTLSNQLEVTVRDLDKVGDVADTAMAKGATDVSGIWFDVADPAKAMNDAKAKAVEAARVSAQSMATAAGVNLGAVVSISESSATPYPYPFAGAERSAADAAIATPVQPGTQDLQASVTVVFQID